MPHPWHLNRRGSCNEKRGCLPGAWLYMLLLRSQLAEPELSRLRKTLQKGTQCLPCLLLICGVWDLFISQFKRICDSGEETRLETSSALPYLLHSTPDSSCFLALQLASGCQNTESGGGEKKGCLKQIDSLFTFAEDYGNSIWQCEQQSITSRVHQVGKMLIYIHKPYVIQF